MGVKYFISFVFEDWKNFKNVPRSKKSWINCSSPDEHLKDFEKMFEKSVELVGDKNKVRGFYTVYEQTEDSLGNFVYKIVYSGDEGIKYLDDFGKVREVFRFN